MNMLEEILKAYQKPDPNPFPFQVGQRVRIRVGVVEDGQTPALWAGAMAIVESRHCTGIHKQHYYKLRYEQGQLDEFKEEELDARYAKKRDTMSR